MSGSFESTQSPRRRLCCCWCCCCGDCCCGLWCADRRLLRLLELALAPAGAPAFAALLAFTLLVFPPAPVTLRRRLLLRRRAPLFPATAPAPAPLCCALTLDARPVLGGCCWCLPDAELVVPRPEAAAVAPPRLELAPALDVLLFAWPAFALSLLDANAELDAARKAAAPVELTSSSSPQSRALETTAASADTAASRLLALALALAAALALGPAVAAAAAATVAVLVAVTAVASAFLSNFVTLCVCAALLIGSI